MIVLPVIVREMRAEARHAFNYWLRVLGALALLSVVIIIWWDEGFRARGGAKLFGYLNTTLFFGIWILVPLLTADCLSREKREGTIGLLFLTPLKALDIVIAKGLVHSLRAMTLLLAVLPVLMLPFLIGGVGWKEALLAVMTNLASLFLALGAGLLASSWAKRWLRALLLAEILSATFFLTFGLAYSYQLFIGFRRFFGQLGTIDWVQFFTQVSLPLCTNVSGMWGQWLSSAPPKAQTVWLEVCASVLAQSFLAMALSAVWASHRLRRKWQEEPPSPRQLWWYRTFCTPQFWVEFFRRFMRRRLERNPIGWLQERTWSARLTMWVWFGLLVSLYSLAFGIGVYDDAFRSFQTFLAWGLVLNMAFSASGSFRRERETGLLELMLVAPLTERQIIWGRVRGIWSQFGPAIVLLIGLWFYVGLDFGGYNRREWHSEWVNLILYFTATFLTLPLVGLYFSLRYQNFLIATFVTLVIGVFAPIALAEIPPWQANFLLREFQPVESPLWPAIKPFFYVAGFVSEHRLYCAALVQSLITWRLGKLLLVNLTQRSFAFSRGGA